MPFFKRREHEAPPAHPFAAPHAHPGMQPQAPLGMHSQAPHGMAPQGTWPPQHPSMNQHHISELQELHLRMQKLQMQMDELASSVQARRTPASATGVPQPSTANSAHAAATHPGPCPFPPDPDARRFEELDESTETIEPGRARSSTYPRRQSQTSSHSQTGEEVDLEQLIQAGSRARAHSASPAMGQTPTSEAQSQSHPPPVDPFLASQQNPMSQHSMPYSFGQAPMNMPPMAGAIPRQGMDPYHGLQGMPSASFAGGHSQGVFGNEYSPMQGMGTQMPHTNLPGVTPMQTAQSPGYPGAGVQGFASQGQQMPGQPNAGYQFPNPFGLERGPHMPGFGNGFSMQQLPSVLGQIGAQFQMPRHGQSMGMPASPRARFGF